MIPFDDRPDTEIRNNPRDGSYRDFKIRKTPGYPLYSIVPPEGKVMHRELEGEFSHQRMLEQKIDVFLGAHETRDDAFIDAEPPKPKRGRPPKSAFPKKIMEASSLS